MNKRIRKLDGANMDIDLATPKGVVSWEQDKCPWNEAEKTSEHRCAVKNVSICRYFCGVEYVDTLLCCYPHPNPHKGEANAAS
jgi:hypothetical protein